MGYLDQRDLERYLENLERCDGRVHVLMFRRRSEDRDEGCDVEYTRNVNEVLLQMQKRRYEILDIKFHSTMRPDERKDQIYTLITYRSPMADVDVEPNLDMNNGKATLFEKSTSSSVSTSGQWKCSACGAMNSSSRKSCLKCGAMK